MKYNRRLPTVLQNFQSSSATDVSAESWGAGNEAIASADHSDDSLAAERGGGGDTRSFPLGLIGLGNAHRAAQ